MWKLWATLALVAALSGGVATTVIQVRSSIEDAHTLGLKEGRAEVQLAVQAETLRVVAEQAKAREITDSQIAGLEVERDHLQDNLDDLEKTVTATPAVKCLDIGVVRKLNAIGGRSPDPKTKGP